MQKCVQSTVLPPRVYGLLYFPVCVFIGRISFSIVDLIGNDSGGESLRRYTTARRTPGSVARDRATTTKEESGNHKMVERAGFCAASYFLVKQNYSIRGFFSANRDLATLIGCSAFKWGSNARHDESRAETP
jgi:hypothetical protein